MKVTIGRAYGDQFNVSPHDSSWNTEMVVELPIKEVQEIVNLQIQMEELQQRLKPLYEACHERQKAAEEAKKLAREAEEAAKEANLAVSAINQDN